MSSVASLAYFQRLHSLFDRIVELPPEEREAAIDRLTGDTPGMADELRALLEQADRDDSPLDNGAVWLRDGNALPFPEIPGYGVRRCIGYGGSATVYLADQEHAEFTREVALKVVDRVFDAGSLRSVREEQRILARLEHPGIARLYDAGVTAAGQPWLAMELVEGESILAHCRARELPVPARLELFLSVLDAVAYAHAKGIVHRDLKPGNIFVTASGEARLLDFGIAKLTDATDPNETRTLQRALTPAYASPEQMRGDRTTSASDIYSLGVVLYELVTDTLPHEDETPTPRRELRGDLGAILAKALRPRAEDRYASATAMADDLRRVLTGTPATARRDDRRYRTRELVRRHGRAVALVALVVALAVGWEAVSRWRASDERRLSSELAIFRDAEPIDAQTQRVLREGADQLTRFDGLGARENFRRATESSRGRLPGEALAWDGVARAESSLGETGRAADAARRAAGLIAGRDDVLPKEEAERLRARALAAKGDWNAAIRALDRVFSAQPQRIDVGVDLVSTLLACGRTDAADTALGRLRQLVRDANEGDPRIDLLEAEVALQLSEYQRAAAAAARVRDRAAKLQAVPLSQRAARVHGEAISRLDRPEEARRDLAALAARNDTLGLNREAAAARVALGAVMIKTAANDEARAMLEKGRAGCVAAADRRCELVARSLLAIVDGKDHKLPEGIRNASAAVADARAIGDRWSEGYALTQRFVLYNWADDTPATEATVEETLTALRESGNRQLLMSTLTNVALLMNESLELEKAEAYVFEAEELSRKVGSLYSGGSIDRARAYIHEARGEYDLARKRYTAALEKARRAQVPLSTAMYLADLAWLELADDQPVAAAERAREAVATFRSVGDEHTAASTEAVLAWSDARQGNAESAKARLAVLRKAATATGTQKAEYNFLTIEARVAEALEDWPRAIALRRETVRMATQWNTRGLLIHQKAHLADTLYKSGDRRAFEKLAAEILPEAENIGLRGIARQLRVLMATPAKKG